MSPQCPCFPIAWEGLGGLALSGEDAPGPPQTQGFDLHSLSFHLSPSALGEWPPSLGPCPGNTDHRPGAPQKPRGGARDTDERHRKARSDVLESVPRLPQHGGLRVHRKIPKSPNPKIPWGRGRDRTAPAGSEGPRKAQKGQRATSRDRPVAPPASPPPLPPAPLVPSRCGTSQGAGRPPPPGEMWLSSRESAALCPQFSRELRSRIISREGALAAFSSAGRDHGGRQEQAPHQGRQERRQEESVRAAGRGGDGARGAGAAGCRGWGADGGGRRAGRCCHGGGRARASPGCGPSCVAAGGRDGAGRLPL